MDALLVVFALLALAGAWLFSLVWTARHFRLTDPGLDVHRVELGSSGHEISLVRYPPKKRRFAEPVILCHGLAANRFNMDFFEDGRGADRLSLARHLSRLGFDTWVLELRGAGLARVPKGADWNVDDEVNEDVPTAVRTVLEKSDAERVFWVGHSKGGIIQYLFLSRQIAMSDRIAGLVTIGSPGTLRYKGLAVRSLVRPGRLLTRFIRRIPMTYIAVPLIPYAALIHLVGRRFAPVIASLDGPMLRRLFANLPADISRGVATQMLDWVESPDGAFFDRNGDRDERNYERIDVPMLLLAGSADPLAPPPSVRFVADRVGSKDVTMRVMGEGNGRPYGHGDLLVGRHAPDEVFPQVSAWLGTRATSLPGPSSDASDT